MRNIASNPQKCPMRILIVDDNRDILDLVQRVLLAEGYEVITARNGVEALQREAEHAPDLIVLDINLPFLDGWEVCRRIKARRSVPNYYPFGARRSSWSETQSRRRCRRSCPQTV